MLKYNTQITHQHWASAWPMSAETLAQCWQANVEPAEFSSAGQYCHNVGQPSSFQHWINKDPTSDIGRPTLAKYRQANVWSAEFCPAGQYWHNVGQPSSYQHQTNKGPTSNIIGRPMLAQQWLYVQCFYASDEEDYKPAFLLIFFQLTFPTFQFSFVSRTNE